jgi:hypothetical protein
LKSRDLGTGARLHFAQDGPAAPLTNGSAPERRPQPARDLGECGITLREPHHGPRIYREIVIHIRRVQLSHRNARRFEFLCIGDTLVAQNVVLGRAIYDLTACPCATPPSTKNSVPRDIAAVVRFKKHHRLGDLIGCTNPAERTVVTARASASAFSGLMR